MKIEPVRGWMAGGAIRALANSGPKKVYGRPYGVSDNCIAVLVVPLTPESIEAMRESGTAALDRATYRESWSNARLVDRILTAIGITEEE